MVNKAQKALQAGVQWFMIINVQQTMLLCDHGRRVSARHRLHLRQLQRSVQHGLHHILPINSMGYHYGSAEHQASGIRLVLLHVVLPLQERRAVHAHVLAHALHVVRPVREVRRVIALHQRLPVVSAHRARRHYHVRIHVDLHLLRNHAHL